MTRRRYNRVEVSQGKRRPRNYGPQDVAEPVEAAPLNDPVTGLFVTGNDGWRRRMLKRLQDEAARMPHLDAGNATEELKPYVGWCETHLGALLTANPNADENTVAMAEELAIARALFRFNAAQCFAGVRKADDRARSWLRESRQQALAFTGMSREVSDADDDAEDREMRRRQKEFQRRMAENQRNGTANALPSTTTTYEPSGDESASTGQPGADNTEEN